MVIRAKLIQTSPLLALLALNIHPHAGGVGFAPRVALYSG